MPLMECCHVSCRCLICTHAQSRLTTGRKQEGQEHVDMVAIQNLLPHLLEVRQTQLFEEKQLLLTVCCYCITCGVCVEISSTQTLLGILNCMQNSHYATVNG